MENFNQMDILTGGIIFIFLSGLAMLGLCAMTLFIEHFCLDKEDKDQ